MSLLLYLLIAIIAWDIVLLFNLRLLLTDLIGCTEQKLILITLSNNLRARCLMVCDVAGEVYKVAD